MHINENAPTQPPVPLPSPISISLSLLPLHGLTSQTDLISIVDRHRQYELYPVATPDDCRINDFHRIDTWSTSRQRLTYHAGHGSTNIDAIGLRSISTCDVVALQMLQISPHMLIRPARWTTKLCNSSLFAMIEGSREVQNRWAKCGPLSVDLLLIDKTACFFGQNYWSTISGPVSGP